MAILQTAPDAPYIVEAELYGTEKPIPNQPVETLVKGIKAARDLIQQAQGILEGLPESAWEEQVAELADDAANLGYLADDLASAIH